MPEKRTLDRARADKKAGKAASTQAGEFIREQVDHIRAGRHGARSAKQAIAIGLSEARRAGIPAGVAKEGDAQNRRRRRELAIGQGRAQPSAARSRGAKAAARTRARRSS